MSVSTPHGQSGSVDIELTNTAAIHCACGSTVPEGLTPVIKLDGSAEYQCEACRFDVLAERESHE